MDIIAYGDLFMKKWNVLNNKMETENTLSNEKIIEILLNNRGLTERKEIVQFLNPDLDSYTFQKLHIAKSEVEKAIKRINRTIEEKESVVVYTDYDVDGICSGAIVWETLYDLGVQVMPYVPHRVGEGYGLSKKGIDTVYKEYNPSVIITVDHGVSASSLVGYAKSLGIYTIIIDHHTLPRIHPKADVLIHTTEVSAGGLAFFFCKYILDHFSKQKGNIQSEKKYLDLVALATIADLVPLIGANRALVKEGLKYLNETRRVGLIALINESGLKKGEIGVYEVSHILAPRLNSVGRLAHALDALRLLCTKDRKRADALAGNLSITNRRRQMITEETIRHAMEEVESLRLRSIARGKPFDTLLFISHESYQEGIIGLVASRLVDHYYRPAIVLAKGNKYTKASARSIAGFDIINAIRKTSSLLENVGGHPMAAGFTVATENLVKLKKQLLQVVSTELDSNLLTQTLTIDMAIPLSTVTVSLYEMMKVLAPFGVGNPEPVFASYNVEVTDAEVLGKERNHLRLKVRQRTKADNQNDAYNYSCIGFGMGKLYHKLSHGVPIGIAYTVDENTWRNKTSLQLKLKDVTIPEK